MNHDDKRNLPKQPQQHGFDKQRPKDNKGGHQGGNQGGRQEWNHPSKKD